MKETTEEPQDAVNLCKWPIGAIKQLPVTVCRSSHTELNKKKNNTNNPLQVFATPRVFWVSIGTGPGRWDATRKTYLAASRQKNENNRQDNWPGHRDVCSAQLAPLPAFPQLISGKYAQIAKNLRCYGTGFVCLCVTVLAVACRPATAELNSSFRKLESSPVTNWKVIVNCLMLIIDLNAQSKLSGTRFIASSFRRYTQHTSDLSFIRSANRRLVFRRTRIRAKFST